MTAHFTDEALEEYALGRLTKKDVDTVFVHLLECDDCYSRYDAELAFALVMREALSRSVVEPANAGAFGPCSGRADLRVQLEQHSHSSSSRSYSSFQSRISLRQCQAEEPRPVWGDGF